MCERVRQVPLTGSRHTVFFAPAFQPARVTGICWHVWCGTDTLGSEPGPFPCGSTISQWSYYLCHCGWAYMAFYRIIFYSSGTSHRAFGFQLEDQVTNQFSSTMSTFHLFFSKYLNCNSKKPFIPFANRLLTTIS